MVIKYTYLFHSKTLQNLPELGFLVLKQTIWQPCMWRARTRSKSPRFFHFEKIVIYAAAFCSGKKVEAKWPSEINRKKECYVFRYVSRQRHLLKRVVSQISQNYWYSIMLKIVHAEDELVKKSPTVWHNSFFLSKWLHSPNRGINKTVGYYCNLQISAQRKQSPILQKSGHSKPSS
jgi:hypothetical protein